MDLVAPLSYYKMIQRNSATARILYKVNTLLQDSGWARPLIRQCKKAAYSLISKRVESRLGGKSVLNGPFKGMLYPSFRGHCSSSYPKIIGCYEAELHPFWEGFQNRKYEWIWDIGCAEGYYAVGLALTHRESLVTAWDISPVALDLCGEMAALNGVKERIRFNQACGKADLLSLKTCGRSLIVCDCEGYEDTLFTGEAVDSFAHSDLVIELHEFMRAGVTERVMCALEKSHKLEIVPALSDEVKVGIYNFHPLTKMNVVERRYATAERRPPGMAWLVGVPKNLAQHQ